MDLTTLLSDPSQAPEANAILGAQSRQTHPYPTRSANAGAFSTYESYPPPPLLQQYQNEPSVISVTPNAQTAPMPPKTVNFQLLLSHIPQHRARLPLRVHIQPHDTTDSIITTVKNFYGLYEGEGVSFQDNEGDTLIARYENLSNNSTVYVRITSEEPIPPVQQPQQQPDRESASPRKPHLDEPFQAPLAQPFPRPSSRATKVRDASPQSARGYRSVSAKAQTVMKPRSTYDEMETAQGMSDSDGGSVSVSSSRRAKSDHLASAEISLDNILEGGRRKKAKFESSELPLFAPPQQPMTASMSSLSPQRRFTNNAIRSPLPYGNQHTFTYTPIHPPPQNWGQTGYATPKTASGSVGSGHLHVQMPPHSHRLRGRGSGANGPSRLSGGSSGNVLPTPDPTIGSVISDEDVALQLMRLGDPSNASLGRAPTSTLDDALSGKAEVASSVEASSDDNGLGHSYPHMQPALHNHNHHAGPARKKQKGSATMLPHYSSDESSSEEFEDRMDGSFQNGAGSYRQKSRGPKPPKPRANGSSTKGLGKSKSKAPASHKGPLSPASPDPISRKESSTSSATFQQQFGDDEEDLSAKPRCQRCRKSKKGCDRQRPCQRCKDAGIGIEGCVSEDEGNGRKGRFGRHMGVPIKKNATEEYQNVESLPAYGQDYYAGEIYNSSDNGKKRKR